MFNIPEFLMKELKSCNFGAIYKILEKSQLKLI